MTAPVAMNPCPAGPGQRAVRPVLLAWLSPRKAGQAF
jgi:hypothetical protein